MSNELRPKILISEEAYQKIMYWVGKSPIEISGLGKCIYRKGAYHVTDVYLLKQVNTAATTDIDAEAVAKLMFETKDVPGHLNYWWHSHVNMGAFWSGTDTKTIKEFGANGMCLATVFNKRGETRSAFYQKGSDFLPEVFIDGIDIQKEIHISKEKMKLWEKEYEEKCSKPVYKPVGVNYSYNTATSQRWNMKESCWEYYDDKTKTWVKRDYDIVTTSSSTKGTSVSQKNKTKPHFVDPSKLPTLNPVGATRISRDCEGNYIRLLQTKLSKRTNGIINPNDISLRWDAYDNEWVKYSQLVAESWRETNVIDTLGVRDVWAKHYESKYGYPPVDDYDIDQHYMETKKVSELDFYEPSRYLNSIGGLI